MKVAETKKSAAQIQAKDSSQEQPFFSRQNGAEPAFFSKNNGVEKPFFSPNTIQPKLRIGSPDDAYERQADTVADQVVAKLSTPTTTPAVQAKQPTEQPDEQLQKKEDIPEKTGDELQRKPIFDSAAAPPPEDDAVQRKCAECEKEDAEKVQRKSETDGGGESAASPDVSSRLQSGKGGGSPLPADTRSSMESAMGADFSGVRIHTGSEAAGLSQELNAQAFTHGRDIYFNEGKYDPGSTDGQRLLAHELVHTVQQGAVVRRKQETIADIQRSWLSDGADWVKSRIKQGLNWAAERLVPGYSLLNVILGKNLITDETVERSGINIVRAYMRLVPVVGSVLLAELEETDTLTQAGVWTEEQVARFGINFDDIARRLTKMWDEMSIWNGIDENVAIFRKYIGPVLGKFLSFSSVMNQKMKELRFEGALRLVGAHELLTTLKDSPAAFKRVIENPKEILSHFMEAIKRGFSSFKDNFGTHFKNALFGWLLGKAAAMGIQMPKEFSIAGVFHLVAQLAGLTYSQLKALVIEKLGPKYGPKAAKVFAAIEKGVEVIKRVVVEGPIALWELVKEQLTNLKDMVLSQITQLVTSEIIKSAVAKLLSMLNPAGAIVQLALTLYRVIKFFIDNWDTIKEIATGIISSITKVALGLLGDAVGFIEKILGKGVQLIISFLARIFGISDIADKVKDLIKKFGGLIIKARDWLVNWLVQKGKELYEKIFGKKEEKGDNKKGGMEGVEQEIKSEGEEKGKDGEIKREEADQIAGKVRADQGDVIKEITVRDGGETWDFEYVQRALKKVSKKLEVPKINDNPSFAQWFNGISYEEFMKFWNDNDSNKKIKDRLRHPGGQHEWLMVARAPKFKQWGIKIEDIWSLRTATENLSFLNPSGRHHGTRGGKIAHNELLRLIDSAESYDSYVNALNTWADTKLPGGRAALPSGLQI